MPLTAKWRAALLLAAALVLPLSGARGQPKGRSLIGTWSGSYMCLQGVTALTLAVDQFKGGRFSGYFHFFPPPGNPQAREGCYSVRGRLARSRVTVEPAEWITRPYGYVMVGLEGALDASGQSMTGNVAAPAIIGAGCAAFELRLRTAEPKIPGLCRHAELQARAGR